MDDATKRVRVTRPEGLVEDFVAVEEPLEIRLGFVSRGFRAQKSVSITMRTPGADAELAVGFLFGEQILTTPSDIAEVRYCGSEEEGRENRNVIRVELVDGVEVDLGRLQRNFYTTSSCGVCGKSSLEALAVGGGAALESTRTITSETLCALPDALRGNQEVFEQTGGLHAAGLFDAVGGLLEIREDVGRHNAVDKLVGAAVLDGRFPLSDCVLMLSGRASFELLQKALVARIPIVAAVGAPSSLAVELAEEFGITLVGFLRRDRYNAYTHPHRIISGGKP